MNIRIESIGVYHPSNAVTNEELISYFDNKDKDVRNILKKAGRKVRYISDDENENVITMAIEASKRALEKANLTGQDIDKICFITDTPAYTLPCNAIFIHRAIGGKNDCSVYDVNCNCVGMISAMDDISRLMTTDKSINRVLIVGSQMLVHYTEEPILKTIFGDSACAIILEKTNDINSYIIDSLSFTDSELYNKLFLPSIGISNSIPKFSVGSLDGNKTFYHASKDIKNLLTKTNTNKRDITKYFVSQYSLSEIKKIAKELEEPLEKFPYCGHLYGYTGNSSPFISLYESINKGEVKRKDLVVIWSIGSGVTSKAVLMRI